MTAILTGPPPEVTTVSVSVPAPSPDAAAKRSRRMNGVDAARGLALIGMMIIHILPDVNPATGGPAWTYIISAGNASALFALLAGVSIAFTTGRARVNRDRAAATVASLIARAAVIGVIGLALGYTDPGLATVILPYYAMMFLLAIPLVFLPTWGVAAAGVVLMVTTPVASFLMLPHLPAPPDPTQNLGFDDLFTHPLAMISEVFVGGEFPALVWITYVCAGLFIGRLNLRSPHVASRLLVGGFLAAALAQIASGVLLYNFGGLQHIWSVANFSTADTTIELLEFGADGSLPPTTWWWLASVKPHTGTPFDLLSTVGIATAVLATLLVIDQLPGPVSRRIFGPIEAALAAPGKMTLTFYTLHVMFINSVYDTYVPTTSLTLQAIAAMVLGLAWQASAGRGPLEALTAAMTRRAKRIATPNAGAKS